ncbi:MAG: class I SAM-dependent methyltransferase [Deferrisomatales bacterium]|nr:class I SAM-dependent methyltransferase [Deferrisomatales bacterium]
MASPHAGDGVLRSTDAGENPNLARFNSRAKEWDQAPDRVSRAQMIAERILEQGLVHPHGEVLDIGCGTGLLSLEIQSQALRVTALDLAPRMVEALKEKCAQQSVTNVEPVVADVEREPLPGGKYHLIVSSMTLHHLRDTYALLQRCFDALRPGGALAVADLDWDASGYHKDDSGVVHPGFERHNLADQFSRAGFSGVKATTVSEEVRSVPDGDEKRFTTFLIWGTRP